MRAESWWDLSARQGRLYGGRQASGARFGEQGLS